MENSESIATLDVPLVKPTKRWLRMAEIYQRFARHYPTTDFSDETASEMFLHESTGSPIRDYPSLNGFALGKKWMDVTVAGWKEEILSRGLLVLELQADGYLDWFLEKVGVLHLRATWRDSKWWLSKGSA